MINWAYVAGFFDGEGTISGCGTARGQKGGCRVFARMYQNSPEALEAIQAFLGNYGVRSTMVRPQRCGLGGGPPQIGLNIPITSIPKFLAGIRPYVIVKKQKVEDIGRYLKMFPALTHRQCCWLASEKRWGNRRAA